jgi:uncharacterized protein (TIGR03086 family)
MDQNMLDLYDRASQWTLEKVQGAVSKLDDDTPCDQWDVRTLMNHMLDTQSYFARSARGEKATLSPDPPARLSNDPVADFKRARTDTIESFSQPGVIDETGPSLGIAFADQLLHGWDLAKATGQDTTMPKGLPEAAYEIIHGRFTDEQRKGVFKPEVRVSPDATPQARLLAYTGRDPSV